MKKKEHIKATDCECFICKEPAVAFWPVCDPDIFMHPYCRKCLDKEKNDSLIREEELMD